MTERDENGFTERCDSCGAKAFVRVQMVEGELFFCKHHFDKHSEMLKEKSFLIENRTNSLILQ